MLDIEQLPLDELIKECIKEIRKFDTKLAEELKTIWLVKQRPFLIQLWKTARTRITNEEYWREENHSLKQENKRLLQYIQTGEEKILKSLITAINKRNKKRDKIIELLNQKV